MSFILDALKKSENDRQRQNGPALYEVKLSAPRTQLPLWAIVLGVVLVANLGLVMWVLFRSPAHDAHATSQAAPANQAYAPQPAVPQAGPPQYAPAQAYAPNGQLPGQPMPAPGTAGYQGAPNTQGAGTQPMQPPGSLPQYGSAQAPTQPAPTPAQNYAGGQPVPNANAQGSNPDDYAPAAEPANTSNFHVRRATENGMQLYSDAVAGGGLPELRVDMHTYAARPQDRFVLINMKKAREGDMLPEGVKVESITPDGVVVSRNGAQFLLPK